MVLRDGFRRWIHDAWPWVARRRSLAMGLTVFVAAAVAFRVARRAAGAWGIDDAGITYAAGFELADHGSLAPYVEGTPVETYSNPLVFFVVTILRLFGAFDPIAMHVHLECAVFGLMVFLVWSILRSLTSEPAAVLGAGVFATIELATPATWVWYGSGLENVWVSAGLVTLLWLCVRAAHGVAPSPGWGGIAFLVAITRPEAPVYVAGYNLALLVFARPPSVPLAIHARRVAGALAVTTVLYVMFLAWRRIGYGDWLPNTYFAKRAYIEPLTYNVRETVIAKILPYGRSAWLASSALVLLVLPKRARVAAMLLIFLVVSLALPITAGDDFFLGELRFATPFLATCHASYAVLFAVCATGLTARTTRAWRVVRVVGLAAVIALPARLIADQLAREPIWLNDVTIGRVAQLQGGQRWEHQMRLGLPYAVALLPDAGGSLLVGGMQIVDNGFLTDFQMARIGPSFGNPSILGQASQYQNEERRPDLVDDNPGWELDRTYLGTRYLSGEGHLFARKDLVELAEVDPSAQLLFNDGHLSLYLSGATVRTAVPGALVRCELIVAWTDTIVDGTTRLRGSIEGDRDEISLRPYQSGRYGMPRRALLVGAPDRSGSFEVSIELVRGDVIAFHGPAFVLEVTDDERVFARAADRMLADASPGRAAAQLAWLREQLIPRLSMTRFRVVMHALLQQDQEHSASAGKNVMRLRWNARLASLESLPSAIRSAELVVTRRLVAACPAATDDETFAQRLLCLGRVVDRLRRLGYLGILARVPEIADELRHAEAGVDRLSTGQRYRALVGLTLADPSNIALQREVLAQRLDLETFPEL